MVSPFVDDAIWRCRSPFWASRVALRIVVRVAGGMVEQLPDSDLRSACQIGKPTTDRIIERKFAIGHQQQNRLRGESFGD